ncbi:MAG: hypothetical protein K2W91_02375 [Novosphingobium sp.]|nr:hypothetical protein [Novosphingobium sp.]
MEHRQIFEEAIGKAQNSRGTPWAVLVWLLRLAQLQPIGLIVMLAFVTVMVWGSASAFLPGMLLGIVVVVVFRSVASGDDRSPEA